MKDKKLLDKFAEERIHGVLEDALENDDLYKEAQEIQNKACEEMEKAGLNEKQNQIVDRVISAVNYCGAVYGAVAYRQGLEDGIELSQEVRGNLRSIID